MSSIPQNEFHLQAETPTDSAFVMHAGTLYMLRNATHVDALRYIQTLLTSLPDRPTPQNSRLWTEAIDLASTACELALDEAGGREGGAE